MNNVLLKIKNIKKRYGAKEALKGVSLDIYKGEIVGLLGVNGAGKTTLSSIIATLHPPTEGDIECEGVSIYDDIATYRYKIGFCPQKPNLDPALTLEQNLRFSGSYYGMTDAEITQRLDFLVNQFGLQEYLYQKANVLSGGYKQRFMIARALMHNPQLVILDEPTVGLDPHIRRQLWQQIRDLKQLGVTIILTTHYLDEAEQLSDRVCVLDNGLIKLIDTPDKLKADFNMENLEDVFIALMSDTMSSAE
ncbi:MAG TPA: ABC transporter ATP-binding protein [Candidatus Babeliales bacterium]|jgi:ABC-2 type transport system ATP-binding protein|nr:ABC transporter ATP-binding protein [Candidatus Babeliales bacterium]